MTVAQWDGKIVGILPSADSPAYKAGLGAGDILVTVDGKSTDNHTTAEAATMLKGPRGTPVQVVASRKCTATPLTFTVIRDHIPRKRGHARWVKPAIAYLGIESFNSETTTAEVEANLTRLGDNNITSPH